MTDLVIRSARIWQGHDADPVEGDLRIADGIIVELGHVGAAPGVPVLEAAGRSLIPGLIDAHFHAYAATLDGLTQEARPLSLAAIQATHRLGAALRRGFTTVRDPAGGDIGLARAIDAGLFPSPRYLYTGPGLSQTGGHGDEVPADLRICLHSHLVTRVVDGVDAVRLAARGHLKEGASAIKLMTSGGVFSPSDPLDRPQYSAEEIRAVADEAHRRGAYVAAHAYSPEAIIHSIENGVRTIEHGNLLDAATAAAMAERGAYLDPTLATYDAMDRLGPSVGLPGFALEKNRIVFDRGRRAIEFALEAGVPVGFGTDLLGELETLQLHGLRLQAEAMGVGRAIDAATAVNAELIGRGDVGRLQVGFAGDAVLLDGDPLTDPDALFEESRERVVIQGGRIVS